MRPLTSWNTNRLFPREFLGWPRLWRQRRVGFDGKSTMDRRQLLQSSVSIAALAFSSLPLRSETIAAPSLANNIEIWAKLISVQAICEAARQTAAHRGAPALPTLSDRQMARFLDQGDALADMIDADFRDGRVEFIHGWIISSTELALCLAMERESLKNAI
jgi:hypothetical protein